jgi:tripartite-type tricarboxylate transporter receptor subunit TctC
LGGAPEVPTLDELDIKNIDVSFWHRMWASRGTPQNVIAKVNLAILADPMVQEH